MIAYLKLFQMASKNDARTIITTLDPYFSPSMKDIVHLLRGRIKGVRQVNFAELKNVYYLIYVNNEFCYKPRSHNNKVLRTVDDNSSCPVHEEADTKIEFHVCKIDFDAHVTIKC
ncbi:hypothetical protein WA026_016806 [Henosepilachna vigintioctopunctata]|uniref:Uncharacterized protein n=1 Tax=Henosepilachna vigintioctopunctata TaxID=420089 RepID=A0AAW1UZC4_9CUCU